MNRISIVQSVVKKIKAENYLEIGVSKGHAFLSIDAKRKIAVDPVNQVKKHVFDLSRDTLTLEAKKVYRSLLQMAGLEDSRFFEVPSDDFFAREKQLLAERKIDMAFIDGLHTYGQALRDTVNALQYLKPNGVIVLHDCNPTSAAMETPAETFEEAVAKNSPNWNKLWCGDVWKVIVNMRSLHKDLRVFVLDCDMGIGIITRGTPESILPYSAADIDKLTYADLERERGRLLNLKSVSYFETFLASLPQV